MIQLLLVLLLSFSCSGTYHLYVGCYATADISFSKSVSTGITNVDDCDTECDGYFYFGITAGSTCLCLRPEPFFTGSKTTVYPPSSCSANSCSADTNLCGSSNYVSVYRISGATASTYSNLGCFKDYVNPRLLSPLVLGGNVSSVGQCAALCPYPLYNTFGVVSGDQCYCGARFFTVPVPVQFCTTVCSGNSTEFCGGYYAIQSFQWNVRSYAYVGCYGYTIYPGDGSTPETPLRYKQALISYPNTASMTTDACALSCAQYPFFALSAGTQCYCGDTFPSHARDESECNATCVGDASQICGGPVTTAWSVYQSTAVFCGDGILSGTETCDLGQRTQSIGCVNCQTLKHAWSCKSPGFAAIDYVNPSYDASLPLYFALDLKMTAGLCYGPDQGDDLVFDFGDYRYFFETGINKRYSCQWLATPQGSGMYTLLNGRHAFDPVAYLTVDPNTGAVFPTAVVGACSLFVIERTSTGYGFYVRPSCALHLALGVGSSFSGSKCQSGNCNTATVLAASQSSNIIYIRSEGSSFSEQSSSICAPICGDLYRTGAEECDDGNVNNGDGCDSECKIEAPFTCVDDYDMPFRQKGYTPEQITTNLDLYFKMIIYTDTGYNLGLPLLFAYDEFYQFFHGLASDTPNSYTFFGLFPAPFGGEDGEVYMGVKRRLNTDGYLHLTEYWNGTRSLCRSCVSNSNWSVSSGTDYLATACNGPVANEPETLRWKISFDDDTQSWKFRSGVSNQRLVIVYQTWSYFPVIHPFPYQPYPALTNDTFYDDGFNILNTSTTPSTIVYPTRRSICTPICGDGLVVGGESCDDMFNNSAACLNCTVQPGWVCPYSFSANKSICRPKCGDGRTTGSELCDDGFGSDGTIHPVGSFGCTDQCQLVEGWVCVNDNITYTKSLCNTVCGDGIRVGTEQCDDNNTVNDVGTDGCTNCTRTFGWNCDNSRPNFCRPVCGDGHTVTLISNPLSEDCDDGFGADRLLHPNLQLSGCSDTCKIVSGWNCTNDVVGFNKSTCVTICGDGLVVGTETCDTVDAHPGCVGCLKLPGYSCSYNVSLQRSVCSAICGDGNTLPPEECDDGGLPPVSGDGCSDKCQNETGWQCQPVNLTQPSKRYFCWPICGDGLVVGNETCDDKSGLAALPGTGCVNCQAAFGWTCPYDLLRGQSVCNPKCGDGYIVGLEQCDDGVTPPSNGDGCSATCQIENGWNCTYDSSLHRSICDTWCGDSLVAGRETCDSGSATSDSNPMEACNSSCLVKPGWVCDYTAALPGTRRSNCIPKCGDGMLIAWETCDDGVIPPSNGDGCNSTCFVEPNWLCSYNVSKSVCGPICGDGVVIPPETCDDGNTSAGCIGCRVQTGWICPYNGTLSNCAPVCGDGLIVGDEQCDDHLQPPVPGDGCSESCKNETYWSCTYDSSGNKSICAPICGDGVVIAPETCDDGGLNNGNGCIGCAKTPGWICPYVVNHSVCSTICGDGLIVGGFEQCDDGVRPPVAGDGCSDTCQNETGWSCTYDSTANKSICNTICGDGLIRGSEKCDDANGNTGNGCLACAIEGGWICPYIVNRSVCSPICGDGQVISPVEECDDGVTPPVSGDGCSSSCKNETGWICSYSARSICNTYCGDGIVIGNETCDDFVNTGNGCMACQTEDGWSCSYNGSQSVCSPICGDGLVLGAEECDDAVRPPLSGDGCSDICQNESNYYCAYDTANQRSDCSPICGDGVVVGTETCDDGGPNSGNGCFNCTVEFGWACPYLVNRSVCSAICGDGLIFGLEGCDDGVRPPVGGDGCSDTCQNETGWICSYDSAANKSVCAPFCGDAILTGNETCDDGGPNIGNGCLHCQTEVGWNCPYIVNRSVCSPICGDGQVISPFEECDDGVTPPVSGDGCSSTCKNETGWHCVYNTITNKSDCFPICGDGKLFGLETCDDFVNSGNGCLNCSKQAGWSCPFNGTQSVCSTICGDGFIVIGTEQCDKAVQLQGCDDACEQIRGFNCSNVNSSYGVCLANCGDGILIQSLEECDDGNSASGDGCDSNCKLEPSYVCNTPNATCTLCYGPWIDNVFNESLIVWSDFLESFGLPASFIQSLDYAKCSLCTFGSSLSTRQVDTKPYCTNATNEFKSCSFPCRGISTFFSQESINALKSELDKKFVQQVLLYFGLNLTYSMVSSKKRDDLQSNPSVGLNFQFQPCDSPNVSQGVAIVSSLSTLIVPNIPNLQIGNSTGCEMDLMSSDNSTGQALTAIYAGIGAGVGALFLIILIATLIALYFYKQLDPSDLHLLPKEIRWSYEEWFDEKKHWDFQGGFINGKRQGYYFKLLRKLKEGENENDLSNPNWKFESYERVMDLFELHCCKRDENGNVNNPYCVKQITQIYNRDLVTSFISNWRTQNSRMNSAPHLFANEAWATEKNASPEDIDQRRRVIEFYCDRNRENPWNNGYVLPESEEVKHNTCRSAITLAVHGTDLPIARSIAQTGFANLSSLDAGFYGRGIYFSTFAEYVFLYIFTRANPCIILSWVACGHTYPVIERHESKLTSLLGLPIKAGYMSHYVKVSPCGVPILAGNDIGYDEIVIPQESQIAPAFLLHLERSNFSQIAVGWDRICQRSIENEKTIRSGRSEDTNVVFNPREIPLSHGAPHNRLDGGQFHAALSPRAPVSARADLLVASDVSLAPSIATHVASSTGSSARGKPDGEQSPVAPSRVADPELDLKDKTVGVLTGQFVQTKSTHISLNPLLLHKSRVARDRGAAKRSDAWDYQRGAETKGEKLPKAYVRKETYKANQEAAQALRLELQQMKNTETFHSAELHWTLFTEFEEIQYFNYCRLKEEKADSVATPIIIGVSPDSLYLCDPVKGNTIKTIADHLISSVTYENDCSILIEFAYQHPPLHIQNESIEALACVLKKMFEIRVHDLLKVCMEKEKQFLDKGSCTVDERCQLLIGKHTSAVKFTFDTSFLSIVEKSSKLCRNYQWSEIAAIHMVLDMDGTLQVYMNDSASPSFILDHSNGATNIVLFHLFYRFHDTSKRLSDKSHTVVEI